jgi:hypothetical protein
LFQGAAAGVIAAAVAATLIFVLPGRRAAVNRQRTDPAVIALERWASPLPFGSDLREGAIESLEPEFGEEGER